jgi:hypothetical protein
MHRNSNNPACAFRFHTSWKWHQCRVAGTCESDSVFGVMRSRYLCAGMVMMMVGSIVSLSGAEDSGRPGPRPRRTLSDHVVHEVETKLPKYDPPPKPANGASSTAEEPTSSPDVLRLPTVTVTAETPLPPEWAMITPKERLSLAIKARPGLKIGNLFGTNNGYALAMQREERDVGKKAALTEIVQNTRTDDSAESRRVERLLKAALVRDTPGWTK